MGRATITPIYDAGLSKAAVDVSHVHANDDHIPMREVEDRGHGIPAASHPTGFRYSVWECRRSECGVRITTTLHQQMQIPELKGIVIEHEDGRIETYGDVGDDWRTNERQAIVT